MLDTKENPEFGSLDNQTPAALHNWATFLPGGKSSSLLIFWDLLESHQLLDLSLQHLDKSIGASDASSVPVVYGLSWPSTPSMASPIPSVLINATIHKTIGNFSANLLAKCQHWHLRATILTMPICEIILHILRQTIRKKRII
jgi:hypothetical protein